MKRLVGLPLDERQEDEIMRMLDAEGIQYRETRSPFRLLGADAIWVADEDYPRACAVLESEANAYAAQAREEWKIRWAGEYKSSYLLWLWSRIRNASLAGFVTTLLLIALVAVMLLYPLAYFH